MIAGQWLLYAGVALLPLGTAFAVFFMLTQRDSWLRLRWQRHLKFLAAEIRFLRLDSTPLQVAYTQVASAVTLLLVALYYSSPAVGILIVIVWMGPKAYFSIERGKRIARIEEQLDGWLLMLSNMLKATGSLGDAMKATTDLVRPPIAEEIDLVLKEIQFGTSTDQALKNMGDRVNSRLVRAAITTLLVGRQTGGELPHLLEQSAGVLREMWRLEGVVRSQTSQAKSQMYIMAMIPVLFYVGFSAVMPGFYDPLYESVLGYTVLAAVGVFWVAALFVSSKILDVEV